MKARARQLRRNDIGTVAALSRKALVFVEDHEINKAVNDILFSELFFLRAWVHADGTAPLQVLVNAFNVLIRESALQSSTTYDDSSSSYTSDS